MRAVNAIFTKQLHDFPKNISVAFLYVMYPVLAAVMSFFIPVEEGGGDFFTMVFAMMFVGSTPMITIANTIAEDNEYKSLRFLVMAGVRPHQYVLGLGAFAMIMALLPLAAFALVGGFGPDMLVVFVPVALMGCVASVVLGGVVGLFSKNVQQCAAIYTPLMLVISFLPFLATFNESLSNIAQILFTHQIFLIFADVSGVSLPDSYSLPTALGIIGANVMVFGVLFAVAYRKKGLRG